MPRIVVPTLPPYSYITYGEGGSKFKHVVTGDFAKAKHLINGRIDWDEREIVRVDRAGRPIALYPTIEEATGFFAPLIMARNEGRNPVLTVDVETSGDHLLASKLLCVGLGWMDESRDPGASKQRFMCIPFHAQYGARYWSPEHEEAIRWYLGHVLADPSIAKNFHNGGFDTAVLWSHGFPVNGWRHCTMQAHHTIDSELPHNLGFVASRFLHTRFWKDDVKGGSAWIDMNPATLRLYCLHAKTRVVLADGTTEEIASLVHRRFTGKVRAVDQRGNLIEAQVYAWHKNKVSEQKWFRILTEETHEGDAGLILTPDHKVCTPEGWIEAKDLRPGQMMFNDEPQLAPHEFQLLLGTLLGDSSLRVSPVFRTQPLAARKMGIEGGHTNSEYTSEKIRLLQCLQARPIRPTKTGHFYPFTSRQMHQLHVFWAMLYDQDGTRRLRREVLAQLSDAGLAWWFGDDGCRQKLKSGLDTICLAIMRYPRADQEMARAYFEERFAGRMYLGKDGVLRFSRAATENFSRAVGPYLHHSVRYKLPGAENSMYVFERLTPQEVRPSFVRIASVGPYELQDQRARAYRTTRFCISTTAGNFFTSTGLVKNCLRDVKATDDLRLPLEWEIEKLRLTGVYQESLQCAQIMSRATIRGILIDTVRRDSTALDKDGKPVGLRPQLQLQKARALAFLRSVAGPSFDPMKPVQLRALLFDKLMLPRAKLTSTGLPATNKEALMILDALADTAEQRQVLTEISIFRQADKFESTFVNGLTELLDGRFHPTWSLRTTSGRFSSSPNFQNLPSRIKRIFRSAPGYSLVGVDLSQAELRLMAYYANEPTLLEMYRTGVNVHTANASMLFRVKCPPEKKDHINPETEAYIRDAVIRYLDLEPGAYDLFPVVPGKKWGTFRTLAKNYEFGCARKGTKVAVLDQRRGVPIEDVKPGDWTWCWDGYKYMPTKVKHVWSTGTKPTLKITLRDGANKLKVIEFTSDHMMLMRDGTKKPAGELVPGDRLMPFRRYTMTVGYSELDPTNDGSRMYEHRWAVGDRGKHVHHLNEIRLDNRPENLQSMASAREHSAYHPAGPATEAQLAYHAQTGAEWREQWARDRAGQIARLTAARTASPKWQEGVRDPARWEGSLAKARAARVAAAAAKAPCSCGAKAVCKGLCNRCYQREYKFKKNHVVVRIEPGAVDEVWDLEVEHEAHNFALEGSVFVGNSAYGAAPTTVHTVLRSKRDPETLALMFPGLPLSEIEALGVIWRGKLRRNVVAYWENIQRAITNAGQYRCPISGRIRWFRDGFKRNEMLNVGIQMGVASHMNRGLIKVQGIFDAETGGAAQVVQQVHDALTVECPTEYERRAGEILQGVLSVPFEISPGSQFADAISYHADAVLPADTPTYGTHLNEV